MEKKVINCGKIRLHNPHHAAEVQNQLKQAGLKHVGEKQHIRQNAVGLYWADGLYFTTDRIEVFRKYPGQTFKAVEYRENLPEYTQMGHRTQREKRIALIQDITENVVKAMNEAIAHHPNIQSQKKIHADERKAGWQRFMLELRKTGRNYVLSHVRIVLRAHFKHITQPYDSTFSRYYREVQK